jgi:Uma2 family endonuclease
MMAQHCSASEENMTVQLARRPFTTTEYHRLIEAGILTEDERVELIDGELIKMAPIGPRHAACVNRLDEFLRDEIKKLAIVSAQNPIQISEHSEPQPDIALLKRRDDFYAQDHPSPEDVLVEIEVADTTAESDREVKIPTYARAGIAEAWLIDLYNDRIEVHTRPASGVYQEVRIVLRGQRVTSISIPQLKLKADDILG